MTNFEEMLLKTGTPDLICAYVTEYKKYLSKDFVENFATYRDNVVRNLLAVHFDVYQMPVKDFLVLYAADMTSTMRTRIYRALDTLDVHTIADLLKWNRKDLRQKRNLGELSVLKLEEVLKKVGLKLQ